MKYQQITTALIIMAAEVTNILGENLMPFSKLFQTPLGELIIIK